MSDPLRRLIAFCEQTARDGIVPSLAWFTETADELKALAPLSGRCVIGEYCKLHGFVHGAEAEELRERIETLIAQSGRRVYADDIQQILDDVDARDSCAFVESAPSVPAAADERKDP